MNKDFMQYVYTRIEKALSENAEYMELQSKNVEAMLNHEDKLANNIADEMEAKAEELCYMKGFNDALQLMLNSKEDK